jgi:hemoglobin-like flavoprotein
MSTPSEPAKSSLNVDLLLSTFLKIEPQLDEFADSFYQILFNKYPQTELLFLDTDMRQQKIKLVQSLQLVISNVNNADALKDILKALGARHVEYGTALTDYPLIGDSLLQALEKHLDRDWNEEVKQTWTNAYQMIAQMMMQGAKEVANSNISNNAGAKSATNQADLKNDTVVSHTATSSPDSIFIKLIPVAVMGMVAIHAYLLWPLMKQPGVTQPASSPPSLTK